MTATDGYDAALVYVGVEDELLASFNRAGVLMPADVHTALRLARLAGEEDPAVVLAAALAVRAPRVGHVSIDLTTVRAVAGADASEDVDIDSLPWPDPGGWLDLVAASPLVAVGELDDPRDDRPLRLLGTSLYLDRSWRDEVAVAADVTARAAAPSFPVDGEVVPPGAADSDQVAAVRSAAARRLTVIAGGPGTGKTTTVARFLAVLYAQATERGERMPLVALAAPTGKAAARLEEAVRAEAGRLDVPQPVALRLAAITGSTVHRLLGSRPGRARFRHHRGLRLPHDVIVVDEASMISLALMARLAEAVRPDARLVLVGDPEQLVSVEAGAVLADVVGPAGIVGPAGGEGPMAASVSVLRTNHRFSGALADLAAAVRAGDADTTIAVLAGDDGAVGWLAEEPADAESALRDPVSGWGGEIVDAARDGDATGALRRLGRHRVLCAHRRGPDGVAAWNDRIEGWLAEERPALAGEGVWYAGRPVMVTANDYSLRLYNGDTGITIADSGHISVVFEDGTGEPRRVSPSRLADVDTVYATTVHKSQGSEFDDVTLLMPAVGSRLLTRELLYTAVTRARHRLLVVGTEAAIRAAVGRRIARASGLTARLWPEQR